eukprot:CAMPEP_0167796956 /NCGR_PEP_ID=MMETSP0111_2-20121227/15361_1 /TAXON_ID=91324 /ORGANISM="Lotharella globosa, Strain CCCM811" /LENGTH=90 /DNA_ID=CAMNT_0007690957 /DNA_START=36 /DNA_END=305 /DNA_ORIENTATION=-
MGGHSDMKQAPEAPWVVFVEWDGGKLVKLEGVEAEDKVSTVKGMIEARVCIPAEHQRLDYFGVKLEDSHTLADYNVHDKCTLHLTPIKDW